MPPRASDRRNNFMAGGISRIIAGNRLRSESKVQERVASNERIARQVNLVVLEYRRNMVLRWAMSRCSAVNVMCGPATRWLDFPSAEKLIPGC